MYDGRVRDWDVRTWLCGLQRGGCRRLRGQSQHERVALWGVRSGVRDWAELCRSGVCVSSGTIAVRRALREHGERQRELWCVWPRLHGRAELRSGHVSVPSG